MDILLMVLWLAGYPIALLGGLVIGLRACTPNFRKRRGP